MWLLVLALAASAWGGWISASVPGEAVNICSTDTHLYVVGYAYDVQTWRLVIRIEVRDKASGQLVKTYTEPGDLINSCVAIGGRLYLGRWFRISVYDPEPRRVDEIEPSEGANPPRGPGHPLLQITRLATDGSHLYVGGVVVGHGRGPLQSFIHKRSLNLTLLGERYFNLTLSGVGVNPATGHVWAVGGAAEGNRSVWIVLILDQNLNTVREARPGEEGWPYGVVFDDEGSAYVYGPGGVVKMSKDGDVVSRAEGHYQRVLYSGGRLYLTRCNQLAVYDKNLKPLYTLETPLDTVNGIAVEGGRIYLAGQKAGKYATAALESGGAPEPALLLTALAAASIATALILKRLRKH